MTVGRDFVGGKEDTERSDLLVADVERLRICVSAEKLRDLLNDDGRRSASGRRNRIAANPRVWNDQLITRGPLSARFCYVGAPRP